MRRPCAPRRERRREIDVLEPPPPNVVAALIELLTGLLMMLNLGLAGWLIARPWRRAGVPPSVQRAGTGPAPDTGGRIAA